MGQGRLSDVIFSQVDGMNDNCSIHSDMFANAELSKVIDGKPATCSHMQASEQNKNLYYILSTSVWPLRCYAISFL